MASPAPAEQTQRVSGAALEADGNDETDDEDFRRTAGAAPISRVAAAAGPVVAQPVALAEAANVELISSSTTLAVVPRKIEYKWTNANRQGLVLHVEFLNLPDDVGLSMPENADYTMRDWRMSTPAKMKPRLPLDGRHRDVDEVVRATSRC